MIWPMSSGVCPLASVLSVDMYASQDVLDMQRSFTMWSETCRLPQLLEGNMPGYSLAATRYDEDARKVGCARRVVGEHRKVIHGCLQTS